MFVPFFEDRAYMMLGGEDIFLEPPRFLPDSQDFQFSEALSVMLMFLWPDQPGY